MDEPVLDVRQLAKSDKHPTIFAAYGDLPAGGSFILVNNHDPKHLRDEFEADHPGSYRWEYVEPGPRVWRIRIGGRIDAHSGPDLDVLIHVLSGRGRLAAERGTAESHPGDLVWLPKRSVRKFAAGPDGLRYPTVHQRRQALLLEAAERAV